MPTAVTIVLIIMVTINGQEVEHTEQMASAAECSKQARLALADALTIPNDGPMARNLRIGCFAHIEPTPEH